MSLKKYLREQGYDLIDGPVRNHKPLQLWLKKTFDEVELYYSHIDHAFISDIPLIEVTNDALSVNATKKDDYGFNIGITLLEDILKSLGLGNFELSAKIKNGKKVTISYDNSITKEYPIGEIENYFSKADFRHSNPALLKNANRNNILVISGVVFAKNLVVEIETDFNLSAELIASLNNSAEGKLDFTINSQSKLKMISNGIGYFPIAVKANRIDFDKGSFKKLKLITDSQDRF
ncbi:hypothetical protein [Epilithonimonas sp.]|uniref:gasdermin n=1 Tax=Epilithonimonas sp. TaxID=2894511 RepID=UPI0028A03422|nr:hypothetical protein [Epilithonimonas sp.]